MLLTGTFQRSVDQKLRIAIPKPLRAAFDHPNQSTLYVAPGTDGSLALYTEEAFSRLAEQLAENSPTGPDVRAFGRLFYARAQRVEIDRHGRVRIPAELARSISLEKEAVLVGVRDHLELWRREKWESYVARKQAHYDEIAENAFGPSQQ